MRSALVLATSITVLSACGDVLHSTSDIRTACEIDPTRDGCAGAAGDAAPIDFCAWSRIEAQKQAQHACAWLGACEPSAGAAFGPCMFQALMAYDCAANPSHRPMGSALAGWSCLATVATCGDVDRCVQPGGPAACLTAPCADAGSAVGCAGGPTPACSGTAIDACDPDGGAESIDCASNGAQACGSFPTAASPAWVACLAGGDGGACAPSRDVTCSAGVARSCPSGVAETLDCAALLNSPVACNAGMLDPAVDWTLPCDLGVPCAADSCTGGTVNSCARGTTFAGDCAMVGLGACRTAPADDGTIRATCAPP